MLSNGMKQPTRRTPSVEKSTSRSKTCLWMPYTLTWSCVFIGVRLNWGRNRMLKGSKLIWHWLKPESTCKRTQLEIWQKICQLIWRKKWHLENRAKLWRKIKLTWRTSSTLYRRLVSLHPHYHLSFRMRKFWKSRTIRTPTNKRCYTCLYRLLSQTLLVRNPCCWNPSST